MRIFDATPVRPVAVGTARILDVAGFAATAAAAIACAVVAMRLGAQAQGYFEAGGGRTFLGFVRQVDGVDSAKALLPGLHLRALWYGLAWGHAVFACGFACLAVAGTRALYWRAQAMLRSL
jgi:hypothetical protein